MAIGFDGICVGITSRANGIRLAAFDSARNGLCDLRGRFFVHAALRVPSVHSPHRRVSAVRTRGHAGLAAAVLPRAGGGGVEGNARAVRKGGENEA